MHLGVRLGEPAGVLLDLLADQVDHLDAAAPRGLGQRPARDRPDVPLEIDEAFENAGPAADAAPGRLEIAAVADRDLTLAVVAETLGLQHRRPPDLLDRAG